jgi:hypothetical protein
MEPYPSGQFGFVDDPDRQFGNCSVWTRTRTRSDGPEPLLTLALGEAVWSGLVVRSVECAFVDAHFLFFFLHLEVDFIDRLGTVEVRAVAAYMI